MLKTLRFLNYLRYNLSKSVLPLAILHSFNIERNRNREIYYVVLIAPTLQALILAAILSDDGNVDQNLTLKCLAYIVTCLLSSLRYSCI